MVPPSQTTHQKKVKPQFTRCGGGSHTQDKCSALSAICHKCGKRRHFSKQLFTKRKGSSAQELYLDSASLGTVCTQVSSSWSVNATVKQHQVPSKVDTVAEVTAISDQAHHNLKVSRLKKPNDWYMVLPDNRLRS